MIVNAISIYFRFDVRQLPKILVIWKLDKRKKKSASEMCESIASQRQQRPSVSVSSNGESILF